MHRSIFTFLIISLLSGCTTASKNAELQLTPSNVGVDGKALAFFADENFGRRLSKDDRNSLAKAELKALEFGRTAEKTSWNGKSTSVSGDVEVSQPFRVGQSNCRRFTHNLTRNGETETVTGTACRSLNGPWRLIS